MAISSAAFASISNGNTTSVGSLMKSSTSSGESEKAYSSDEVSISQEALELVAEMLAQRSAKVMNASDKSADFTRVAKALPKSENFEDMVEGVATWSGQSVDNLTNAPDRNAYVKNPQKYVTMWKNLYDNYTETMKELGLNPNYSAHRDALQDANVSSKVQYFFKENLNKETQSLMKMFNITI